ncbi:hypothetical protein Y017_13630 [Alcanivorax sp. 97CO-5]|nr:hypothetical protein Y017_13630 [Alcanivorax sp. 97CO-5]PKG01375.1 hypothetical protein Y019_08495 [Alcanivorax sp. 97CO-6]
MGDVVTTQAYLWGWFAYLLGSIGVLFVWWWLTRPLSRWAKVPLRTLLTALLLTPWSVSARHDEWAPAWVVSLFDGLAQDNVSLWRAGGPLVAMLLVALVVAALELWRQRRKQAAMLAQQ